MTTFNFTGPDGKSYKVDGPDGATPDQAFGILQQHLGAQRPAGPTMASGIVRSASEGVPILGGLLNKADAATNAALAPYVEPLLPSFMKGDSLKEPTFSGRYEHALRSQQGMDEGFEREHPYVDLGARVGGAVASTLPVAATATGAKLLGLTAKTLPGLVARGAASGAAIGAVDSEIRGGDPTEGAIFGGAGGAAGPIIGAGVSKVLKPFLRFGGAAVAPEIEAASKIKTALDKDAGKGLSHAELSYASDQGQPVTLMDQGSRATQRLARTAANYSPEAQEILSDTVYGRSLTQNTRTADFLGQISNYPDAQATKEALDKTSKATNRVLYKKAMDKGANGVWNSTLERLINHPWMRKAIPDALEQSNAESVLDGGTPIQNPFVTRPDGTITLPTGPDGQPIKPTLEFWDALKKNIDGRVDGASPTATSRGEPNTVRMGTNLLHALTRELDTAIPEYATARGVAAKFFGAKDALQAGRQTAMPGTTAARADNRVVRDTLAKYSPAERKLFEQGFLDQTIETLLNKPDSFNILRAINQNPRAKERMAMILGADRYAALEAYLRVEGLMDQFRTAVSGNSTTARQLGDMKEFSVVPEIRTSIARMFEDFLTSAAKRLGAGVDERVAKKVAEMLTSPDGKEYAKALKMIAKTPRLLNAIRQNPGAIGSIVARSAVTAEESKP